MSEEERAAEPEAAAPSTAAEAPDHAEVGARPAETAAGQTADTAAVDRSVGTGAPPGERTVFSTADLEHRVVELEQMLERRVAELEQQLEHERDAASDYLGRWQRAQADFSNLRRRQQQEQEQMRRFLAAEATRLILPALDSFERAFATLPNSLRRLTWIDGVALVSLQLQQSLQALGVQPIAAEPGHAFDPARHEAIGEVATAEHPEGHIAVVVQRGYEVEGAVLRPALVQVARPPDQEDAGASNAASATEGQTAQPSQTAPPGEGPAP